MKKKADLYEQMTNEFFQNAEDKGLSENLIKYVWNVLIAPQKSYSFCSAHGLAYTLVGLQEMNLVYHYPEIYWNTANLIVDSAGIDSGDEEEENEEEKEELEQIVSIYEPEDFDSYEYEDLPNRKEKVKRVKKTIDYGRTAAAIGKFQSRGIVILPPDINNSSYTFTPNAKDNTITYGLRGITRVSADMINQIINNRPYSSFKDFMEKNKTNKLQTINLIKSGAFDRIEGLPREQILNDYFDSITDKKTRLTLQNMQMLINYNLIPEEMSFYSKLFLFNKDIKKWKDGLNYKLTIPAINFINKYFSSDIIFDEYYVSQKTWDNIYKKAMDPMRSYLKDNCSQILNELNQKLFYEVAEKYGDGNISKWEMDSISFYYHNHELDKSSQHFDNFFNLPEQPIIDKIFNADNGEEIKLYKLNLIAGTVVDKNKLKNTVTLLTQYGVVNVKIYKNQFSLFDKQISIRGEDDKKKILERSWFSKGTLLMVQGIRRGNDFIPKKYKSSFYPVVTKINNINDFGDLDLQFERLEVEE